MQQGKQQQSLQIMRQRVARELYHSSSSTKLVLAQSQDDQPKNTYGKDLYRGKNPTGYLS